MAGIIGTNVVVQVGIVVRDIEKTKKKFAAFLGVEEPISKPSGDYAITQTVLRGKPAPDAAALLAFFNAGDHFQLELIQPNGFPSTWQEFLDEHGEGVHHIAFTIKDMKGKIQACEEFGMPLIQKAEYSKGNGRYAYMDASEDLKVLIELLEND